MLHDAVSPLIVRGLGCAEVRLGDLVLAPEQGMLFPLALVLAQRAGERIPRRDLIESIWPGADEAAGRHSLRQALYRLRKAGLALDDLTDDVRVDPARVDSDLSAVLRHDWPFRAEPEAIEAASNVLPGFVASEGGPLAEWLDALRARLAGQHRQATLHRIALARREGRWREADAWAQACLRADPLNEEATCARAEALAMVGAKNAALEVLDTYLRELGDRAKVIGLPARLLRRRISELTDTTGRRVTATSVPFVGRHDLLATAQDALAQARRGEPTVQWFTGPPGIGKSRLMVEITRAARMAGWCAVAGGAWPSYEERPFATLTELLPQLLDAPGALGADPGALNLMRQMGRADTGEPPLPPEEARVRQHAVYLAWVELMDAVLAETPLAVLVDDAHWSDPLTLLMFARFCESRPAAPLALILSARRIPVRDDGGARRVLGASHARIAPMTDAEMLALTRAAAAGRNAGIDDAARRLASVSGGNPLFLGHLLQQHWTQREPQTIPADLATLIDDQIRTLSLAALRLLQACALLGRHASLPRLERVLGLDATQLVAPFGELDDLLALPSELGQSLAPHDLWTERVRRSMTAGVFRTLAVSAARVLEADASDDGGIEIYWDAARLYQDSGEKKLAYATMMRCAEYLSHSGSRVESCRAFAAAAEYASAPRPRYQALSGQLADLHAMGESASAQLVIDDLRHLVRESEGQQFTTEQEVIAIEVAHSAGAGAEASEALTSLATDAALSPDGRLHAIRVGLIMADNFHDRRIQNRFARLLEAFTDAPRDVLFLLRAQIVQHTLNASFDQAGDLARRCLSAARQRTDRSALLSDLRFCSIPSRRGGQLEISVALLDEAFELSKRHGYLYGQYRAADMKAGLMLDYGRFEEAHEALCLAESRYVDSLGKFVWESLNLTWSLWHVAVGDLTHARSRERCLAALDWSSASRHAMLHAAIRLQLAVEASDEQQATRLLGHLRDRNADVFAFGGSDQIALAVWNAIRLLDGESRARDFARQYVNTSRVDRFTPPHALIG